MTLKLRFPTLLLLGLASPAFAPQCVENLSDRCELTLTCANDTGGTAGSDEADPPQSRDAGNTSLSDSGPPVGEGDCRVAGCDGQLACDEDSELCVECIDDSQCSGSEDADASTTGVSPDRKVCDTASNSCVECTVNNQCSRETPYCNTDTNVCVQCLSTTGCGGEQPICNTFAGKCTATCSDTDQCREGELCRVSINLCVSCLENSDCAGGAQCNTQSNECVECVNDSACTGSASLCDPATNRCVACVGNKDCSGTLSQCSDTTQSCVECLSSDQCTNPALARCNQVTNACDTCTQNEQCVDGAPNCRTDGLCVECIDNSGCDAPSVCDTAAGQCVQCTGSEQCTDPALARCNTTVGTCQGCEASTDCADIATGGPLCRTEDQLCVSCLTNGDCNTATASRCDDGTGSCAGCSGNADCTQIAGLGSCKDPGAGGQCVECVDNDQCGGDTPICDTGTNTCVQCVQDTACSDAGASRCENRECVACRAGSATDCAGITGNGVSLGVCDASASAGVCVQCTGTEFQACAGNACNSLQRQCSTEPLLSATRCALCIAGNHCAPGLECIADLFNGSSLGSFRCFPTDDLSCPLPFNDPSSPTSIDGLTVNACRLDVATSCAAYESLSDPCTQDTECGQAGVNDGRCLASRDFCSLPCVNQFDCEAGVDCVDAICTP